MNLHFLITSEILVAVVSPLLILYLKSNWSRRSIIICPLVIPVLWYLSYALIHESSHVAGTYLAGGRIVDYQLIPRFWLGEFGIAWVSPEGLTHTWQNLISGAFPYILDVVCIVIGLFILQKRISNSPFLVGLLFMLLVLRPTYEFISELTGFLSTNHSDYNGIRSIIGNALIWLYIIFSLVLSWVSVVVILRRFVGFPEQKNIEANAL